MGQGSVMKTFASSTTIKRRKQAGAEPCQAQEKLGLAEPALLTKTLRLSSSDFFHFP